MKIALYILAVSLAIDNISDRDIVKLEKFVAEMEAIAHDDISADLVRYEVLHDLFHERIVIIAGHGRLRKILQSLAKQVRLFGHKSFTEKGHLKSSATYHRRILEAVKAKDKVVAEELTKEHIEKTVI